MTLSSAWTLQMIGNRCSHLMGEQSAAARQAAARTSFIRCEFCCELLAMKGPEGPLNRNADAQNSA